MSLSALESIDDALDATKELLWPFDRVVWLRLAVVMFFVGGGFGFTVPNVPTGGIGEGTGGGTGGPGPAPALEDVPMPDLTGEIVALVAAVVLVVVLMALVLGAVGAVMEFVFVESLRTETVRLRTYAGEHWRRGLRLFAFRVLFGLVNLLVVGGGILAAVALAVGLSPSAWSIPALLGLVALAIPLLAVYVVLVGNVTGFTTMFVVPIMLEEDRGVLSAWRRLLGTLKREYEEFLAYAVVGFLLGIVAGMARGILVALVALVAAIPFAVVGVPLALVGFGGGLGAVVGAVVVVLALVYGLAVFVLGLVLKVPFQTYLRYYALLVLGDADADLDVIPAVRATVRGE